MADAPRDNFEVYFAEKLWELIPEYYRHEDGLAENPGVLRALVEILAGQAAIVRRSSDRLWEDQFVELCDTWVLPYLGALVGARLPGVLTDRARRAVVALAIYYRRRKGTLALFERLIGDIAGWDGTVVESFRRLGRTRHNLDPEPGPLGGRLSGTQPGGWADLRHARAAELASGPFDEFHHTADLRHPEGVEGRYGITRLLFFLYRLQAYRVEGVTPVPRADGVSFSFDPSGRDIPLFMPRQRGTATEEWRAAREWELPAPLECRVLGHAEYLISAADIQALIDDVALSAAAADDLRRFVGQRCKSEAALNHLVSGLPSSAELLAPAVYAALLRRALIADCGKHALLESDPIAIEVEEAPASPIPTELIAARNLSVWTTNAPEKRLVIDPELGRFQFLGAAPDPASTVTYHYGFSGEIGAGTYDRRDVETLDVTSTVPAGGGAIAAGALDNSGVTHITDSATYGPLPNKLNVQDMTMIAANQQRPYLRLASNWVLNTGANEDAFLMLDGLWLGADNPAAVVLRGDYEQVTIRHCTFDPGGTDRDSSPIAPVALVVEGQVETLLIDHTIMGPIRTLGDGVIELLDIRDSIIQSLDPGIPAIRLLSGELELRRTTVFGDVDVNRLCYASEALVTGLVDVTDTQHGCFRFSAALENSRVPSPYEAHFFTQFAQTFTSRTFGDPGYAQLSLTAPPELLYGAENGSEIGAFSALLNPNKLFGLQAVVEEFLPFGLLPVMIQEA